MSNNININGHELRKTQIGATEYTIFVFNENGGKLLFQFNVSLQPSGKDDVLPTYQLSDKSQVISKWTKDNLNVVSDWLTSDEIKT